MEADSCQVGSLEGLAGRQHCGVQQRCNSYRICCTQAALLDCAAHLQGGATDSPGLGAGGCTPPLAGHDCVLILSATKLTSAKDTASILIRRVISCSLALEPADTDRKSAAGRASEPAPSYAPCGTVSSMRSSQDASGCGRGTCTSCSRTGIAARDEAASTASSQAMCC